MNPLAADNGTDRGLSRMVAASARPDPPVPALHIATADLVSRQEQQDGIAAAAANLLRPLTIDVTSGGGTAFNQILKQAHLFEQVAKPSWLDHLFTSPMQQTMERLKPHVTTLEGLFLDPSKLMGALSFQLPTLAAPSVPPPAATIDWQRIVAALMPPLSAAVDLPSLRVTNSALSGAFQPERMAVAGTVLNDLLASVVPCPTLAGLHLPLTRSGFVIEDSGLLTPNRAGKPWGAQIDAHAIIDAALLILRRAGAAAAVAFLLFLSTNLGVFEPRLTWDDTPLQYVLAQVTLLGAASKSAKWGQDNKR